MKIPVFVSRPTTLNEAQTSSYEIILEELDRLGLEARRLGDSDYPSEFPLREVYVLAKHCSGGVILGFEQIFLASGISERGTGESENHYLTLVSISLEPVGSWDSIFSRRAAPGFQRNRNFRRGV